MSNELLSLTVNGATVVFVSFPDSLREKGFLFTTKNGYNVRSCCYPELFSDSIYVCGSNVDRDSRELNFKTLERVEDFVNSLERFCTDRDISFSREGRIVLGGL